MISLFIFVVYILVHYTINVRYLKQSKCLEFELFEYLINFLMALKLLN